MPSTGLTMDTRLVRNPADDYRPPEHLTADGEKISDPAHAVEDIPPKRFIRMPVFYMLWPALAMVTGGGLTAIGLITA